jgi:Mycothiol maleylpyruvate isomerase N-terminal domain
MATSAITRPNEVEAFLATLADTPPDAMTACDRWTTHDLGAHLAGTFEEVVRHLRAYADGHPLTSTRGFEEREAPFKLLSPDELLRTIERGDEQMRAEVATIVADDPDATLTWTRRQMRVDSFLTHLRSECAIHRWDMVGDDETSWRLLGSFDLFKHAITAIGSGPMSARGLATGAGDGEDCVVPTRSRRASGEERSSQPLHRRRSSGWAKRELRPRR